MRTVIHVGLHKTASTWLQARLFPALGGILNDYQTPWEDPIIRPLVTGDGTPPEISGGIVSSERLGGHPAVGWMDADAIADRMACWQPDAGIIVGTRNPESHTKSLYQQLVRHGECRTLEQLTTPRWRTGYLNLANVSDETLRRRYERRFPALLLAPLEDLISDPEKYVGQICEFIGRPVPEGIDFSPLRPAQLRFPELYRRLNRFVESDLNPSPIVRLNEPVERFKKVLDQTPRLSR